MCFGFWRHELLYNIYNVASFINSCCFSVFKKTSLISYHTIIAFSVHTQDKNQDWTKQILFITVTANTTTSPVWWSEWTQCNVQCGTGVRYRQNIHSNERQQQPCTETSGCYYGRLPFPLTCMLDIKHCKL